MDPAQSAGRVNPTELQRGAPVFAGFDDGNYQPMGGGVNIQCRAREGDFGDRGVVRTPRNGILRIFMFFYLDSRVIQA
jgi:hypothetical protein